jgi:hypothetical protein
MRDKLVIQKLTPRKIMKRILVIYMFLSAVVKPAANSATTNATASAATSSEEAQAKLNELFTYDNIKAHKGAIEEAVKNWQVYESHGSPAYEEVRVIGGPKGVSMHRQEIDMTETREFVAIMIAFFIKKATPNSDEIQQVAKVLEAGVPKHHANGYPPHVFAHMRVMHTRTEFVDKKKEDK